MGVPQKTPISRWNCLFMGPPFMETSICLLVESPSLVMLAANRQDEHIFSETCWVWPVAVAWSGQEPVY